MASFATYMTGCFANPLIVPPDPTIQNLFSMMLLDKYHGWIGGASSLAVIIVGIALFAIGRKYFKWRITASYFIGAAVMSIIMSSLYGDARPTSKTDVHTIHRQLNILRLLHGN